MSCPGSQFLFDKLLTGNTEDRSRADLEKLVSHFSNDEAQRIRAQLELHRLAEPVCFDIPKLIWHNLVEPPLSTGMLLVLVVFFFASLATAIFTPLAWIAVAVSFTTNLFVHFRYESRFGYEIGAIASLGTLVSCCSRLLPICGPLLADRDRLEQSTRNCARIHKRTSYLSMQDPLMILDYVNVISLLKVLNYNLLRSHIEEQKKDLERVFRAVGFIDMCLSVSHLRKKQEDHWCIPETVPENGHLNLEDAHHPCIAKPVGNTFSLQRESAIITGTNMSGKTTFLKTLAVNIILGNAINTCLARSARMSRFFVETSIDVKDDLTGGKSLFASELDAVQEMIQASNQRDDCILFIDELFRGTNPAERVALASAVIQHLDRRSLVVFSTHDLEIPSIVGDGFGSYHFSETLEDGELYFDYKLKAGLSNRMNAIDLLASRPIPKEIAERARALVNSLLETK